MNNSHITLEYLQELLRDQKLLSSLDTMLSPGIFKLLNREIMIARHILFHQATVCRTKSPSEESEVVSNALCCADAVTVTEKIYVPVHLNPQYNFVGRIIGPGGSTIKLMEKHFDCKIHIRGRGSVRSNELEIPKKGGKDSSQDEDLHLIVSASGDKSTIQSRMQEIREYLDKLFGDSVRKGIEEDEVKQNQLLEYAIVKGTYREMSYKSRKRSRSYIQEHQQQQTPQMTETNFFPLPNTAKRLFINPNFMPSGLIPSQLQSLLLSPFTTNVLPNLKLPNFNFL